MVNSAIDNTIVDVIVNGFSVPVVELSTTEVVLKRATNVKSSILC